MTRQVDNEKLNAVIQYRRGALHFAQDDFSETLRPLAQSYKLLKEVGHRNKNLAVTLCGLIKVHLRLNRIDSAHTYINEASTLARELDLDSVMSMIEEVSGLEGLFKRVCVNYLRFGLKKETAELEEWLKKTSG